MNEPEEKPGRDSGTLTLSLSRGDRVESTVTHRKGTVVAVTEQGSPQVEWDDGRRSLIPSAFLDILAERVESDEPDPVSGSDIAQALEDAGICSKVFGTESSGEFLVKIVGRYR